MRALSSLAFALALGFAAPAAAQGQAPARPTMSKAEMVQLIEASGFKVTAAGALNVCGQPSRPRFTFLDLNGDRAPEAVITDRNPDCYGPTGDMFSVLLRTPKGQWKPIVRGVGNLKFDATRTGDWQNARITTDCERIWTFDGRAYAKGKACVTAGPAGETTMVAATGASAAKAPVVASEYPSILAAAGFRQQGGKWSGQSAECEAMLAPEDVRDLNGDGVPEAQVVETGSFCYGGAEQGVYLLTRAAPGRWTLLFNSPGIAVFRETRTGGWPDMMLGGPGFCHPVYRWTGKTYAFWRSEAESIGGCDGQ